MLIVAGPGTGKTRIRAVTHLDVSRAQVEEAVDVIREVAADLSKQGRQE